MTQCRVCKKEGNHVCPRCKKELCGNHVIPDNHRCKFELKVNFNYGHLAKITLVFVLSALFYFLFNWAYTMYFETPENDSMDTGPIYVNETVLMEFKYSRYDESYYDSTQAVYGFLRKEKAGDGYVYYVVDDFGEEMALFLTSDQQEIIDNSKPEHVYLVSGILKKRLLGLYIRDIEKIEKTNRPYLTVEKLSS